MVSELDNVSDANLVVAIARCREPALAEAYRRHGGAVYSLAKRVSGSSDLAEDVTQEVFIKLWESPERFDSARGTLRSFLLSGAHSRAVDLIRSQSARSARERKQAAEIDVSAYDIERHAWDLHLGEQVKKAVGTLPEAERRAIELAYFEGRTYKEVAQLLEQPEGTVKSRIRSGLGRLRGALSKEGVLT